MKSWLAVALASALIGFLAGKVTQPHTSETNLSSVGDLTPPDNYSCATADEFVALLKQIHYVGKYNTNCNSPEYSRLSKVLKFLSDAKADIPQSWVGARDALANPIAYINKNSVSTSIDLTQKTTIAFNQGKTIHLGGRFLVNDTLDSAITLLHEAHHSDANDTGHVNCRWGDVAATSGGCDQAFSNENTTGSYSYAVLIGVAWAEHLKSLTDAQREYLYSVALFRLATRFNVVPHTLANPVELIYLLNDIGEVRPVNPLTGELGPALESEEPIERIQFFESSNGFMAYAGTNAYIYRANGDYQDNFFTAMKLDQFPVKEISRMSVAQKVDHATYTYLLTPDNQLKFVDINPENGDRLINDADLQPQKFGFQLEKLTHARIRRYGLTNDNEAVMFDDDDKKISTSVFNEPPGFKQLDGGLFYSSLMGVTTEGKLRFYDSKTKRLSKVEIPYSRPITKIQNSISFAAALLDNNRVELHFYSGPTKVIAINSDHKIVDMAVARSYMLNQKIFGTTVLEPSLNEAIQKCDFIKAYPGLWAFEIVGVTRNKQVATYNPESKTCTIQDFSKFKIANQNIESLELVGTPNQVDPNMLSYPAIVIKRTDGSTKQIRPYAF